MGTLYWRGDADAVAQVHTASIDSVDATPANNTFFVTIGGVAISAVGDTDVATTATNLRASLNASTHPYFAAITWSGGTGDIIGTADTAGVPFVAALTETGAGTGAVTDFASTTASAGPNDWGTGDNWLTSGGSQGTAPVSTDTVIIENTNVSIAYGLDQNAIALGFLRIDQSFTGKIGLDRIVFATSADGATTDSTKAEYREDYLKIGTEFLDIGEQLGPGTATGSTRLKINNVDAAASTQTIHNTASTGDGIYPAVRLLNTHASSTLLIRKAPGGVGVAIDEPGETTTYASITISDETGGAKLFTSDGLTLTTYIQNGGSNSLRSVVDGTITTMTVNGGVLTTNGDFTVTTLNVNGGTANVDHERIGGVAVTTANLNGGTTNVRGSSTARTWTTINLGVNCSFSGDSNLTITTLNEPTDPYKIDISEP
ncbi:MAG: hypothetical protein V3R81_04770 [Gammaproteobacteria bacterium]